MERLGTLIFSATAVLANALPKSVLGAIVALCSFIHYASSPGKRRAVRENLAGALVQPRRDLVHGIFRIHAMNIVEMIASSRWRRGEAARRFEFDGREALDAAMAEGKGVILVSLHTGGWETGAVFLSEMGYRLHVVAGVQLSPMLTAAAKRAKEKLGIEVINPEDSSRRLLKALSTGGVLALLVDGNVYTGAAEVVFFGKQVRLPEGPVRLARATGAPIVVAYCRRLPAGRHRLHIEYLCSGREIAGMSESEALARVYGSVERFIRENADQWIMFRRLWENAP